MTVSLLFYNLKAMMKGRNNIGVENNNGSGRTTADTNVVLSKVGSDRVKTKTATVGPDDLAKQVSGQCLM